MPVRECNWYGSRKVDKDEAGIFYLFGNETKAVKIGWIARE